MAAAHELSGRAWSAFTSATSDEAFCRAWLTLQCSMIPEVRAGLLLLRDAAGLRMAVDSLSSPYRGQPIDLVVGIESRGFILGAVVADRLGAGFIPVRKIGKLPSKTVRVTYDLEYGSDSLEMHHDAVEQGQRVLIVDDLLATGGTACATARLVRETGGHVVGLAFLIELVGLNGRSKWWNRPWNDSQGRSTSANRSCTTPTWSTRFDRRAPCLSRSSVRSPRIPRQSSAPMASLRQSTRRPGNAS